MIESEIRILVCGDFFGGTKNGNETNNRITISNEISSLSCDCDLSIVNLESPILNSNLIQQYKKEQKTGPHLYATERILNTLKDLRINLVTLSNNHILDYGELGLKNTLNTLDENDINYVGVYNLNNKESKFDTFYHSRDNKTIAIINICENEWSTIEQNNFGVRNVDVLNNYKQIKEARGKAENVIVIFHGGNEFYNLPSPEMQDYCRLLIEFGANAVICHHTHVYSGFEDYLNGRIFYGLGNFYFENVPFANIKDWNYGYTVLIKFGTESLKFELIPYFQDTKECVIRKLTDDEHQEFNNQLINLNKIINNRDLLKKEYDNFLRKTEKQYLSYIQPYNNRYLAALFKRNIIPNIWTKSKLEILLNLIRCESHRVLLIKLLKSKI